MVKDEELRNISEWTVRLAVANSNTYFCLLLIPLGASWEERDICLLHVRMPGQEGCCSKTVAL